MTFPFASCYLHAEIAYKEIHSAKLQAIVNTTQQHFNISNISLRIHFVFRWNDTDQMGRGKKTNFINTLNNGLFSVLNQCDYAFIKEIAFIENWFN